MVSSLPALRRAAPRIAGLCFQCSQYRCVPRVLTQPNLLEEASFKSIRAFETSTRRASSATSSNFGSETGSSSPLSVLGKSIAQRAEKTKWGFFPRTSQKSVAYWLLGSAASVFGIVIFGGLTRLTESGYFILPQIIWQDANYFKPEYYRMEACNRQPPTNRPRGLDI